MAIAKIQDTASDTTVDVGSQIKENVKINDVSPSTTPWVDSVAGYRGEDTNYQVEGSPWRGNYYQQLKELGDVGDSIDARIDATYQQYSKINNYVAKLQGSLGFTTNAETKESTLTGEIIITDTLIPNRGDLWVASRGVDVVGLFVVTSTERLSSFHGSGYRVDIALIEESKVGVKGTRYTSLDSKVVANYYYNENYLYLGTSPTLTSDELYQLEERNRTAQLLGSDYVREFYSKASRTLTLTVDGKLIYDPYLTMFVTQTFQVDTSNIITYRDQDANPNTFWDSLIYRRLGLSSFIMDKANLAHTTLTQDLQFLYGLHHTPISYIVSALSSDDPQANSGKIALGQGCYLSAATSQFSELTTITERTDNGVIPVTPNVCYDNDYVLSASWYAGNTESSVLESMISDWLNKSPLDAKKLTMVLEARATFSKLERYYLDPIIVFLLINN